MKIKLNAIAEGKLSEEEVMALKKYFQKGGTWQHLLNLNESDVEEVYSAGYTLYAKKEFDQALAAFAALIQLSPYVDKHWIAIGAAAQGKEDYSDALHAYEVALTLNEENVGAYFYAAQCCYALDQVDKAVEYLKKVVESSQKTGLFEDLSKRASLILGTLPKGRD